MLQSNDEEKKSQNESKLAILLSILEPLLINNVNLEIMMDTRIFDMLMQCIESQDISSDKFHIYVKFAMRCLTSSLRHPRSFQMFTSNQKVSSKI